MQENRATPSDEADRIPDERIREWKRTLDPQTMWPETTHRDRLAAYQDIFTATARVLRGEPAFLSMKEPALVRAAGVVAFVSGTGPLLGRWVERGHLRASAPLAVLLADHLAHGRRRADEMGLRFARVAQALAGRGIVPTVLKGTYTARRYFEEPGVRLTSDIDVLVSRDEYPSACDALRSLGLRPLSPHALPYRQEWGPGEEQVVRSVEMSHADSPWTIDLHTTLDRGYFGLVAGFGTPDQSMMEPWTGPFGTVRVPAQPLLAAHLAVHASADFPHLHLIHAVELILVLRADLASGRLGWGALADLLGHTGTRRFAFPGFALAERLVPGLVKAEFLDALTRSATPRMRRTFPDAVLVPPQHFPGLSLDMRLAWAKGPLQIATNIFDWLYPTGPEMSAMSRFRVLWRRLRLLVSGRVGWRSTKAGPRT